MQTLEQFFEPLYSNQRRWNEAEQLKLQVMDIQKKVLGPEHPDTLFVKASAKTLSSYFVVFAYIAYNLAQS
jgi:Tetratricopeptide repeat